MKKFMGVNNYNVEIYFKGFELINNSRDKTRMERFVEILCYFGT